MSLTIQNTQGVATLCPGLYACCPSRAESTYSINLSKRLCQNSFVSLRARPAIPYYLDSHDRMRCRVKPGKTRRERLHHFDTPTKLDKTKSSSRTWFNGLFHSFMRQIGGQMEKAFLG